MCVELWNEGLMWNAMCAVWCGGQTLASGIVWSVHIFGLELVMAILNLSPGRFEFKRVAARTVQN